MGIKKDQEELELLCTKSKYVNFKEGKTYTAIARASMGNKYTDFRIEDEDGDLYTIEEKNLKESGPLQFKIVEKTYVLDNKEDIELWQIRKIFYSNYVIMM